MEFAVDVDIASRVLYHPAHEDVMDEGIESLLSLLIVL